MPCSPCLTCTPGCCDPFLSCLKSFFCCTWCTCCAPNCCDPLLSCLRTLFCSTCCRTPEPAADYPTVHPRATHRTHAAQPHARGARAIDVPMQTRTRVPAVERAVAARHERAVAAASAAAAPQPQPKPARTHRVPKMTVAPLPALPFEVADHVEWYQDLLAGVGGRVAWWMGEGEGGEAGEREERRRALVAEVEGLRRGEERVWGMVKGFEGAEAWRKEARRRRERMQRELKARVLVDLDT
ncbi:hypothetical protein EDC01DRAFT_632852 [Geopyxis carbonaria]|nr:hypothetical protein EDC01DRAFT_632852 [Geopyxis carbonaria]